MQSREEKTSREEETSRGVVVMPNIPNFANQGIKSGMKNGLAILLYFLLYFCQKESSIELYLNVEISKANYLIVF